MIVINRLPYHEETTYLTVADDVVAIRKYQVVVWVSLNEHPFPTILDTGHSHNFTISREQLGRFSGLDSLPVIGYAEVNRRVLPQVEADIWLHGNKVGTGEPSGKRILLRMDEGITLYPDGTPGTPRLPLLGMRAISKNHLKLVIDGRRRQITISRE